MRKLALITILFTFAIASCNNTPKKDEAKKASTSQKASKASNVKKDLKVELYVMSQCPYGVMAENSMLPVIKELGNTVDFHLDYIVTPQGNNFKSLHGPKEVAGNIVQLCAKKYSPERYFDFILCQNKNARQIPSNWESCAKKAGINTADLKKCKDGQEGKDLLKASAALAKAAKANGSPTIKINGKPYRGGRSKRAFKKALCAAFPKGKAPATCAKIKPAPVVQLYYLSDKRCKKCARYERGLYGLKRIIEGLKIKKLDYGTPEGKKLYQETKIKMLPAIFFDDSINKDKDAMKRLGKYLTPAGKYKSLRAFRPIFDPTAEICDNGKDDTGNGKVDCDDETCKNAIACRKEIPNRLDVFVMSQCPYGVAGMNALKEVIKNFGDQVDIHVNYIASKVGNGFKSLHGQAEVDENIRELCAMKHYPKKYKYFDYIWCRNKNIRSKDWKKCAVNGIDPKVIETCSTGDEGKKLLEENIKIAQGLGIGASPTWLANNKYKFSGISAEAIKKQICKYNKKLKGCDKTLSSKAGVPKGGACGK